MCDVCVNHFLSVHALSQLSFTRFYHLIHTILSPQSLNHSLITSFREKAVERELGLIAALKQSKANEAQKCNDIDTLKQQVRVVCGFNVLFILIFFFVLVRDSSLFFISFSLFIYLSLF